ncbi:MAG: DNA-processing protein DprA, partial [Faecalibacterium sp.]
KSLLQMPQSTPLEAMAQSGALSAEETYPDVYYWLWLAAVLGPASPHAGRVLDAFGDAATAYAARETAQFAATVTKAVAARVVGNCLNPAACADRLADCAAKEVQLLTFADPDYPIALARIPDPPLVLYCTGHRSALQSAGMVGMVGTRRPTAYGASAAARFGRDFARCGAVIVSGLADGLDGESHRAATTEGAVTIGVMGTPISKTYPAANIALRKEMEALGGLTLSEYPDGFASGKTRGTFLQRNRIIAALSDALVVIEAREKSGTMSTVAHAERYETPIFAVPGSVFSPMSEGTNLLLRQGRARMLLQSGDVLRAIGLSEQAVAQAEPQAPLSPNAQKVLACIGATPTGVGSIASQSGLAMGAVLGALTSLELEGRIISLPGRQYRLK